MRSVELLAEVDREVYRKAARLRGLEVLRYSAIKRSMIAATTRHSFGPPRSCIRSTQTPAAKAKQ